ncbi:hypothetical protein ILYODFUR_015397 [Ilyodon furcidens]|uniref:Uncharacterized protein n=1 Tax=Ilyodon furcidens TaxID=33524 RepID=A0ABV0TKC8_9TELE
MDQWMDGKGTGKRTFHLLDQSLIKRMTERRNTKWVKASTSTCCLHLWLPLALAAANTKSATNMDRSSTSRSEVVKSLPGSDHTC